MSNQNSNIYSALANLYYAGDLINGDRLLPVCIRSLQAKLVILISQGSSTDNVKDLIHQITTSREKCDFIGLADCLKKISLESVSHND